MKKILYISLLFISNNLLSQKDSISVTDLNAPTDSIAMGPGYINQIYYNLDKKIVGTTQVANWDIAHLANVRDNGIRINNMNGWNVYNYPKGDNTAWSSVDSVGFYKWLPLYNSLHQHNVGAFNQSTTKTQWDFSWGVYNSITHEVTGDSLYILTQRATQSSPLKFYKFMPIKQTSNGNFIFKIADLNGANEFTDTILQSLANKQYHKFYSFSTKNQIVREPETTKWHISFTRYYSPAYNNQTMKFEMYPTMGIENNPRIKVAKVFGKDASQLGYEGFNNILRDNYINLSDSFTSIGSDWKFFDGTSFKIDKKKLYVIKTKDSTDKDSSFYLLWFYKFAGSSTGKVLFNVKKLENNVSVYSPKIGTLNVFPNPTNQPYTYVSLETPTIQKLNLIVTDMLGKQVYKQSFINNDFSVYTIPTSNFSKGIYNITIQAANENLTQKLIVE